MQDELNHRREMLLTEVEEAINESGAYRFNDKEVFTADDWWQLKLKHGSSVSEAFYDELFEVIDKEIKKQLEWD